MGGHRKSSLNRKRSSVRHDGLYDFERHKWKLNKIFFSEVDFIRKGSSDYKDFWGFLRKYQSFQRSKAKRPRRDDEEENYITDNLGIPSRYDPEGSIWLDLVPSDPKVLLNRISFQDSDVDEVLTEDMILQFRYILTLYIDFLQREKLKKLKALRKSQANLPIADFKRKIVDALKEKNVIIIAGDTGCGKSTQVPQYLMEAGYENIACTQPRRLACIALANRVAYETLNQFGTEVGYQIRFEKKKTDKTRILFLTEGLLLRQIITDSSLSTYNVIILDEVHERHISGDFLLGVVKCLLRQRNDLKVILMSATINVKLFQDYFANEDAPVLQVPGRLYPIELKYFPIPDIEQGDKLNPAPYIRILRLIDSKYSGDERGDVLIFLSGHKEIRIVSEAAKDYSEKTGGKWIVLPLHSTLSLSDQDKVFDYAPEGVRKCIVSTNIAETSVTIDGIRFVIDSGKVKEMHYDPVCKMRRLKEFWISRASAEQRKGRAGRTGPGVCFRLFSESEYKALAGFSTPEIQRVPLDSLVLQMVSMGLPDARKFPFIEPPAEESIENSIDTLKEQGAMNDNETLTTIGSMLANLPVDVTVGKMLIMGTLFHQIESVLSLAGALSVQSPFTNDAYQNQDCIAARRNLDSDHGDPITLLNSYREWLTIKSANVENSRKWCRKRGLEEQRFYELTKLRNQFKDILKDSGLITSEESNKNHRMEGKSSAERAARHGELKQLRALKREWHKSDASNKSKKVLKIQNYAVENDGEEEDEIDIKDVEFRLKHDHKKVKELLEGAKAYTYKDLTILKLILTSGLYPQYAIGDEFNNSKGSGTEQLFHTKVKPFNVLHPNSNFATNPEYISVDGLDIVSVAGFSSKYPVSSKHQVLIYLSLLETNKSYVMNSLRMPALQTLLLFSRNIDTDAIFSRITFDSWIEFRFPNPQAAQCQTLKAFRLRNSWQDLLTQKLKDDEEETEDRENAFRHYAFKLSDELVDFIHTESLFSVKRLLPGDVKVLYNPGNYTKIPKPFINPFGGEPEINQSKGGMKLNEVLTYDCLREGNEDSYKAISDFECPVCKSTSSLEVLQQINHLKNCLTEEGLKKYGSGKSEDSESFKRSARPNAKEYYCKDCSKCLSLTGPEILRHKKIHQEDCQI